ncbi:hypothetical protein [Streptomyces sp. NPDC096323]|uniref:hypothetical protein n=1 Tax=Streptomyces sp. NPDC096323 TaxID=3155822 RepID=UPI003333BEBB
MVAPHELVAYEAPLSDEDDEPVTAPLVLGWTRTLASGSLRHTDATVMGMPLVLVDTTVIEPADPAHTDQALRVLRTPAVGMRRLPEARTHPCHACHPAPGTRHPAHATGKPRRLINQRVAPPSRPQETCLGA